MSVLCRTRAQAEAAVGVDGDPLAWALALKERAATPQEQRAKLRSLLLSRGWPQGRQAYLRALKAPHSPRSARTIRITSACANEVAPSTAA